MGVGHTPQKRERERERKKRTDPRKTSLYLDLIRSDSEEVIHVSFPMNTEG